MINLTNFAGPKNEATVKLYTEDSKINGVSNPIYFTQKLRFGSSLPDETKKIDTVYYTLPCNHKIFTSTLLFNMTSVATILYYKKNKGIKPSP